MSFSTVVIDDQFLCCPNCSGQYLHHYLVSIFDRQEDDETVSVTVVQHRDTSFTQQLPTAPGENPSLRRHGLAVAFWCEGCDALNELTIAQHKGMTVVEWRQRTDVGEQHAGSEETAGVGGTGSREIAFDNDGPHAHE